MSPDPVTGSSRDDYERTKMAEQVDMRVGGMPATMQNFRKVMAERDAAVKALQEIAEELRYWERGKGIRNIALAALSEVQR